MAAIGATWGRRCGSLSRRSGMVVFVRGDEADVPAGDAIDLGKGADQGSLVSSGASEDWGYPQPTIVDKWFS